MDRDEIIKLFEGKIHCSQIVAGQWAEKMGLDKDTVMRMAGPLGGGCFHGDVCGCVSGALMMIGAAFGHCEPGDEEGNDRMIEISAEFKERFEEECGSLRCRDLTGYDFSIEGDLEKAFAAGVTRERCPGYVQTALEILDEIM